MSWARREAFSPSFNGARAERVLGEVRIAQVVADHHDLLHFTFSHSEYLSRIALQDKELVAEVLSSNPDAMIKNICSAVEAAGAEPDRDKLMAFLRKQKKRAAFLIALADINESWSLDKVMKSNTLFADACVAACVTHLVAAAPEIEGGVVVIGMGKYGAKELNYSSDIDIIILYGARGAEHKPYTHLAREVVRMLQEPTADGYVFRVDLSLRPDPGTTRAAISFAAAHSYYESVGQNWERAAFIKARAVAGDAQLGQDFLAEMSHFIWRKYLDYAVLKDIHAMKRQAHAAIGWEEEQTELNDRDIKRAAGGIRDIEMFVQSQQLIAGGRDGLLRRRSTCQMLLRLASCKWISKMTAYELIAAYRFFRHTEHRLQMLNDEQTHKLPSSEEDWQNVALFCGFADKASFQARLTSEMNKVRAHYGELFKEAPMLGSEVGALLFTGGEDDPETIATLGRMGFSDGKWVAEIIRGWHRGQIPAATSARARELLTDLVPQFLGALSKASNPQDAFLRLDRFLTKLHSAVQFFSLLLSNQKLIELIVLICSTSPRLADDLAKHPERIEALFDSLSGNLLDDLEMELAGAQHYEEGLDRVRLWVGEQQFHLAVQNLNNKTGGLEAARSFSNIAEASVMALQKYVAKSVTQSQKGEMAILAAGSLGAREMTIISDLDIIFIYEGADTQHWIKEAQNIVQALTVQTSKGGLFDVDMRLRPSGKAGPVAVSLDSFIAYQKKQAWVWEHMALTRMRTLSGTPAFQEKISSAIHAILTQPRTAATLQKEVLATRARLAAVRPPKGVWDISASRGGLVDVEFLCQYLQLLYASVAPKILHHSTARALERMGVQDAIPIKKSVFAQLKEAEIFYKQIVQLLHLSVGRIGSDDDIPETLRHLLLQAIKTDNWQALVHLRNHHYQVVQTHLQQIVGQPF